MPPNCTEYVEETYDIYLLPPGEDVESCQSYLRMRNRDGKYSLMFEVCTRGLR
jgi:uridine kinase